MKSRSFPKLDRPPRRRRCNGDPPRVSVGNRVITKRPWVEWRISMGIGKRQAYQQWTRFRAWAAQEAQNPTPRVLLVEPWQDWEREFRAFLDEMPRKPFRFLAMVAEAQKRREVLERIAEKKAIRRRRYERAHHQ